MLDLQLCITRFQQNAVTIEALVNATDVEQARWKPAPQEWSILEVVNHLYDEEREDFRMRLDLTLHQPGVDWPGIDPRGWVTARAYNTRDLQESLQYFLAERRKSIIWLQTLDAPDWSTAREHPQAGKLCAGDLLASWVAHDFLHIRQLAQLHWQTITRLAKPYGSDYAGDW